MSSKSLKYYKCTGNSWNYQPKNALLNFLEYVENQKSFFIKIFHNLPYFVNLELKISKCRHFSLFREY